MELRTAQEQNKTTSLLVSTVTHELITPLRCIVSMTDQLFQSYTFDNFFDERINNKIKMIRSTAKLLLSQINMTLDMSLLTQAHFTPIIKEANLREMCKTTIALLKGQAQAMGILLMLNFNLESDVYFFDEMRVNQILINLMTNAIKFSKRPSHVLVMVKAVTVEQDLAQISISVEDRGIGINSEDLA